MAYKALVKKYHPDTFDGDKSFAEEQMKKINEAFEVLSNVEKRQKYDLFLKQQNTNYSQKEENIENKKEPKSKKSKKFVFKKWSIIVSVLFVIAIIGWLIIFSSKDIENIKDSVVMIKVYDSNEEEIATGSGFCAFESNYIVTNFHVIQGAYSIEIITDDGESHSVFDVEVFNEPADIAILSGNFELEPIKIGNSSNLKAGDISQFSKGDYLSGTYSNEIASFMKDSKGNIIMTKSLKNPLQNQPAYIIWDNGKLIKKPKGQAINILVRKDDPIGNQYGNVTGGRVLVRVGNELRLLSGSVKDIDRQFEEMKKRNKADHGTFYTLDNGSFNRGLRTYNRVLTSKDLRKYDQLNSGGGNFLYLQRKKAPIQAFRSDTIWTPNVRTVNDESYKKGHSLQNEQKGIVLHHTAFMDDNLQGVVNYLTRKGGESAHVVIGFDGTRKVLARPSQVTFHAGQSVWNKRNNVNDFMIGIEFQGDTDKKDLTQKQIDSAVEYIAPIIKQNNIRLEDIVTHQQVRDAYNDYAKKVGEKTAPSKPDINYSNYVKVIKALKEKVYYEK